MLNMFHNPYTPITALDNWVITIVFQAEGVGAGVHLCMWGSMDPTQDSALDMTLGFPADTLTWAGLKGVPQDGMLTVAVRGTAEKPKIDWQGCVHSI